MNIIKRLSSLEAQKIAAGEVVERPVNILKELIENALDAQATTIKISLCDGGKSSITISDNGFGMSKEDAVFCFERYATSKIKTLDDLQAIATFGFRGEALASIGSVAHVELITQQAQAHSGTRVLFSYGKLESVNSIGAQQGTTITVKNLFEQLPARKKFLKTTATEWNQCVQLFKAYALNNVMVHWMLEHDGIMIYKCPAVQTLSERVAQLFEKNLADQVIPCELCTSEGVALSGMITKPMYGRYDKNLLYFFVNGRWVKNYQLAGAVIKAYGNTLAQGKYPAAVISITLNSSLVDINVHPKKEEVLFLHPHKILTSITQAVRSALEQTVTYVPKTYSTQNHYVHHQTYEKTPVFFQELAPLVMPQVHVPGMHENKAQSFIQQEMQAHMEAVIPEYGSVHVVGYFNNTYILLDHRDGLMMIDQHAAHERILYEQFENRFESHPRVSLLFPDILVFQVYELALLLPWFELLKHYGVEIEQFSDCECVVRATPLFFKNQSIKELLVELLSWLKEYEQVNKEELFKRITEKMRAQMACKAAVKAGDCLTHEEQEKLVRDVYVTKNHLTCPHGRPTSWLISLHEIEKKFKRKL